MAKAINQLLLRIEQGDSVVQRRLGKKEHISVGQSPGNDIRLNDERFPKKHVLFYGRNGHFQLNINELTEGEVHAGQSKLNFRDLIAHGLLPRKGAHFTYPITQGRRGIVKIGDAKITFQCAAMQVVAKPSLPKFIGYSWLYATFRDLGRDPLYKIILLTMIILNGFLLKYMSGLPTDFPRDLGASRIVPQRLAKIIVKSPETDLAKPRGGPALADAEEPAEPTDTERNKAEKSDRETRPENMGLLGLLTGSGSSSQSNNLADFLLDKGLAAELDEVMAAADLSLGQGNSNRSDDFDNLIAQSALGGGIDDILEDASNDVETVAFGEKGTIQVDRIGSMTGSADALGKRSEDSVRSVLQRYTGRLTYIYNKYLKYSPEMRGKMVVEVVIAADGSVSDVKLVSSNTNNADFEREILNFIRRWKYDAIDSGSVTVTYPLFFSRVG